MSDRRALILDFDGVLVDTEPLHFESWNATFDQQLGIRIGGSYTQLVGLTLEQIYQLWLSSANQTIKITPDLRQELLARKTDLFYSLCIERLTPMPGSVELIRQAHSEGWYVAIASRSKRLRLLKTLDLVGMPALFDVVLGDEDVVDPVTDRKLHSHAAEIFGITPDLCIVVEDSAAGVADARACGIGRVIGFAHSLDQQVLREAGAHEVVDHLGNISLNVQDEEKTRYS